MKRELGIAMCGLACCLCSENDHCGGCSAGNCPDDHRCEVKKCCLEKGLPGCYQCPETNCRTGILSKMKPYTFTVFAREFGVEELLRCLERNERAGVVYHRSGIWGDYDDVSNTDQLLQFIRDGK